MQFCLMAHKRLTLTILVIRLSATDLILEQVESRLILRAIKAMLLSSIKIAKTSKRVFESLELFLATMLRLDAIAS